MLGFLILFFVGLVSVYVGGFCCWGGLFGFWFWCFLVRVWFGFLWVFGFLGFFFLFFLECPKVCILQSGYSPAAIY